jgi:DNA mismatch repair protein MutL
MGIVKPLPQEVYSKIAAGEVIERPLSVVKELVENALDAQAQNLRIELDEGGKRKIRIRDDGTGFFPEDILPAFSRHSTSKLNRLDDFDRLTSLGFRGEALPSISQVSRITIVSSMEKNGLGVGVELDENGELRRWETACARGTEMTVSDLFYNFPVRRKFLKSDRTELNAILRYVEQVALAYWNIGFTLVHNGRDLFSFPAVQTLEGRIYQIFGNEFVESLQPVQDQRGGGWSLSGWVSRARKGGRDRQRQFFFVNGRPVREKTLMAAFSQAYRGALEKEHSPQGVLLLEMPPHEIDVNIHPMKLEIKFADNQAVFSWVYRSLTRVLRETEQDLPSAFVVVDGIMPPRTAEPWSSSSYTSSPVHPFESEAGGGERRRLFDMPSRPLVADPVRPFRLLGQYLDSYIVVEKGGELVLVDQHNAHETVIFNRLEAHVRQEGRVPSVSTLFPILCELSPREWAAFEERRDELDGLGFELEPLGERSLSIRSYPVELTDAQARETLLALLRDDDEVAVEGRRDKRLATVACKAAIKVNHPLHEMEMTRLLTDFYALDQHDYCPHGRPIVVSLGVEEIERRLKRR